MFWAATQNEYQIVMHWRLITKEFWPNKQHIYWVDNIVADTFSRFPSTTIDQYDTGTSKYLSIANDLFLTREEKANNCGYPIDLALIKQEKQKELGNKNSNIISYMLDYISLYSQTSLDNVEILWFDKKIYMPLTLCRYVINWYYLYLNQLRKIGLEIP